MHRLTSVPEDQLLDYEPFAAITLEQLRDYAQASGDHNPIHLDEEQARAAGLPQVIAHGMLIASLLYMRAQSELSRRGLSDYQFVASQTRFRAMVFIGDIPHIGGRLSWRNPHGLRLELQVRNQTHQITTTARLEFRR